MVKNAIILLFFPVYLFSSALSDSAAALKPGEWKELPVLNWNRAMDYIDINGADGSTAATDWSDNLVWVPAKKQVLYLGAGHLRAHKFIRYTETTNSFSGDPNLPACFKIGGYGCFTHGYDHQTFDPQTNMFFYKSGGGLYTLDLNTETWSTTGTTFPGGWGTGTEFFIANRHLFSVNGGVVAVRHIDSTAWRIIASSVTMGAYHNKAIYSVKHRKVYFGGGNGSPAFHVMDSVFNIRRLADVPAGTIHVAYSCLTTDPVTGTPLFMPESNNPGFGLYSYDTSANSWFPETRPPFAQRALATPVADHGVTFFMLPTPGFKVFLYRYASRYDTLSLTGINLLASTAGLELYLSTQLKVAAHYAGGQTDTTNRAAYWSLDTAVLKVSSTGLVTAAGIGSARVVARKLTFLDTVSFAVVPSTAMLDSITLNRTGFKFMVRDTAALHATGHFTKGSDRFARIIDTVGTWQTADAAVVSVVGGLVTGEGAGGPVAVTVTLDGRTASCAFRVMPRPAFIRRINFQVSAVPYKYGWLAENGRPYSGAVGFGWLGSPSLTSRDDRGGANFLLKSFVLPSPQANFRIAAPAGNYLLRIGMGDATYGSAASPNWTVLGADTLVKHAGAGNTIRDNRVTVSGDSGLVLGVYGPINYLVLISDEGILMNDVADDDVAGVSPAASGESPFPMTRSVDALFISPNPLNGTTVLRWGGRDPAQLRIYDMQGRLIWQARIKGPEHRLVWHSGQRPSGVYPIRLMTGNRVVETKALLIR